MAVDTGDKVTRKYANFRGVDFRGEECSLNRSPDALNVWRNYKKLASIETRPGLEHLYTFNKGIKAMRWHKSNGVERLFFLGGDGFLHALHKDGTLDYQLTYVGANAFFFEFEGKLYAKGSSHYVDVTEGRDVVPFIPTTTIKKPPSGGGETYQDVNMLSPYRINTFRGLGKPDESNDDEPNDKAFHLDEQGIDGNFLPIVTVDDELLTDKYWVNFNVDGKVTENYEYPEVWMMVDTKKGVITIDGDLWFPKPKTDGQDNISVTFKRNKKSYEADLSKIMGCTMAQEFDNRVFFSGNPAYPNMVWHSSLHDPTYFSDLDYYEDGKDSAPIRSLVAGNNALWVFRDAETSNGVFYHVPTIDSDYGKVYPSSHSSISLGCAGRAINFGDDIVFFSRRGMESVSTDITTEQFATHKSSVIDRKMATHPKYKDMIFAEWEGYLLVFMGNDVFLADSRAMLTNENHYEYEWYHWKLGKYNVTCATVHDGVLYIGTDGDVVQDIPEGHIYTLTREANGGDTHADYPNGVSINSYWTTPKDKFGAVNKLKTTNKKGCVVEATGDVDIYAKVEDTGFELIGTNNEVEDYFVSRIKRKKFKDIQLKFQSQTWFCLESATLECFVGGYIKR